MNKSGKSGDEESRVAKGGASTSRKSATVDKAEMPSKGYDPDKNFVKPGMATAAETIRAMRDKGKSGPMKPAADDKDDKPMNLMKMMREAQAGAPDRQAVGTPLSKNSSRLDEAQSVSSPPSVSGSAASQAVPSPPAEQSSAPSSGMSGP
ncbi:MAG: hypothetical protein IT342_27550 [Candidatus Melainabacteria bacterium]|nr:hypothetical protein [Candidatus Melainabacteria bacterium]